MMNMLNKNDDFKFSKINMSLLRTLQWRAVQDYFDTIINLIPSTSNEREIHFRYDFISCVHK